MDVIWLVLVEASSSGGSAVFQQNSPGCVVHSLTVLSRHDPVAPWPHQTNHLTQLHPQYSQDGWQRVRLKRAHLTGLVHCTPCRLYRLSVQYIPLGVQVLYTVGWSDGIAGRALFLRTVIRQYQCVFRGRKSKEMT